MYGQFWDRFLMSTLYEYWMNVLSGAVSPLRTMVLNIPYTVNSPIKAPPPPPIKAPLVFPDRLWVNFHVFVHISANNCAISFHTKPLEGGNVL